MKELKKKRVSFRFHSPETKEVLLLGEFTRWEKSPIKMRKYKDGTFKTSVLLLAGMFHQYKFKQDGNWITDPTTNSQSMNGYGGKNSVVKV